MLGEVRISVYQGRARSIEILFYTNRVIDNDDSLVELFMDTFHLAKPIRSLEIDVRYGYVQLNSSAKIACRDRAAGSREQTEH
jgi:hypothetical protein